MFWPFRRRLRDLRDEVQARLARGSVAGKPRTGDPWEDRWNGFTDLEKATWAAARDAKKRLNGQSADVAPIAWPDEWGDDDRARFDCIAHNVQIQLGINEPRYRPSSYGEFWKTHDGGLEWYEWMYREREYAHRDCLDAIAQINALTVMDVGCGFGVGYAEALRDKTLIGVDLVPDAIDFCRANRPGHFICADILADNDLPECEFVCSSGTIDNSWDVTAYLSAMATLATKAIHLTAYRGWFPELKEHRYMWSPETTAFYNDVSPSQISNELRDMGFSQVSVTPIETGKAETARETRIFAVR